MKLRVRMAVIAAIICLVPLLLVSVFAVGIIRYQTGQLAEEYNISTDELSLLRNPMAIYGRMAEQQFKSDCEELSENVSLLSDKSWLTTHNKQLEEKESFIIVRRGASLTYAGDWSIASQIQDELPKYGSSVSSLGAYLSESCAVLVKQKDFTGTDGMAVSFFVITDVNTILPMWKSILYRTIISFVVILMITAIVLLVWLYNGIIKPLAVLKVAANRIADGNLEGEIHGDPRDEIGELQNDFENMRQHLKEMTDSQLRREEVSRQIMSSISHDLKTPLTAIKGYAEGIRDGVARTPEMQEKYVNIIISKANSMQQLVDELAFFSKVENDALIYNFKIMPMKPYMDDVCDELAEDMKSRSITLDYRFEAGEAVRTILDPEHFHRVIENVVGNAAKYMDRPAGEGRVSLTVTEEPGLVWITVTDNGPGIREEDLEHIFERFFRGDAARSTKKGGSGLGLSIVKSIVEAHGGSISAESRVGIGTTIRFSVLQDVKKTGKQEN